MSSIRIILICTLLLAILIMLIAGIWTRVRVQKIKSQYMPEKQSELKYDLKGVKPKNSLLRVDIDYIIKVIDMNQYKTVNVESLMESYTKENIFRILKIKEVKENYDISIGLANDSKNDIDSWLSKTKKGGMILLMVAPKKETFTKLLERELESKNYKYEYSKNGTGLIIIPWQKVNNKVLKKTMKKVVDKKQNK